jgi:hypothetical protein
MQFMAWDDLDLKIKRRENLRELLVLLSDKDRQLDYAKDVGDKKAIDELLCMWFDDQYHGDKEEFREMYDNEEFKSLKKFNDYYDSISEKIPDDNVEELNNHPDWIKLRSLVLDTIKTLKKP